MSTEFVNFYVSGTPIPKGSTKAFYIKKLNRVITTNANKETTGWESRVAYSAQKIQEEKDFYTTDKHVGYEIAITFSFNRPTSLPKKYNLKTTRPDLDKLARAILDAVTRVLIPDDAQVIGISCRKILSPTEGADITITKVVG